MALVDKLMDVIMFAEKTSVILPGMLVSDVLVQLQGGMEEAYLVIVVVQLDWMLWKEGMHIGNQNRDCCRII